MKNARIASLDIETAHTMSSRGRPIDTLAGELLDACRGHCGGILRAQWLLKHYQRLDGDAHIIRMVRDSGLLDDINEQHLGPHQGLNADWNCAAWYVRESEAGELWIVDDEDDEGTYSLVLRTFNGDEYTYTELTHGTLAHTYSEALA